MTHLRIELNNIQEHVNSTVIKKLYELAISGDLDQSSNLAGVVSIPGGYVIWKNTLETMFPDFHLTIDKEYVPFNDPAFEAACVANFSSDGIGMTMADFLTVTDETPFTVFNGNTEITDMTELKYFTNIPTRNNGEGRLEDWWIYNIPNLTTISFPNQIKYFVRTSYNEGSGNLYKYPLYKCNNIQEIKFPNELLGGFLLSLPKITDLRNTKCEWFNGDYDHSDDNLEEIYFPNTLVSLFDRSFFGADSIKKIVILDGGILDFEVHSTSYSALCYNAKNPVILDFPSNTKKITKGMFRVASGSIGVRTFIIRALTPPTEYNQLSGLMDNSGNIDLYVPDSSISAYSAIDTYSGFKHIYGLSLLPSDYSPVPASDNT